MNSGQFAASGAELDRRIPRTPMLEFFVRQGLHYAFASSS